MKLLSILLINLTLILTSCTPHTAGGVRELGPSKSVTFEAPGNYQALYKRVFDQSQSCNDAWMLTANVITEGELQADKKIGTISVVMHGALGKNYYQVIDIKQLDESKSSITAFYSVGSAESHVKLLKKWVFDDYRKCSI